MFVFVLFLVCVFAVEMAAVYGPLYYISYCWLKIDRSLGDKTLSFLLLGISIILSIIFLGKSADLLYMLFF